MQGSHTWRADSAVFDEDNLGQAVGEQLLKNLGRAGGITGLTSPPGLQAPDGLGFGMAGAELFQDVGEEFWEGVGRAGRITGLAP